MRQCVRGGVIVVLGVVLSGCSSRSLQESAPKSASHRQQVGRVGLEDAAAKPEKIARSPNEAEQGGLVDYIHKPGVMVARLGSRWGLKLSEIQNEQHRRWVARDLLELERLRKKYKQPPPERSLLFVAQKNLYAVLVLPGAFEPRRSGRVDVHLWDYSGARYQVRLSLAAQPGGRLAPVGRVVRSGSRRDHVYLLRPAGPGSFQILLTLSRARKVLLKRNVAALARVKRTERP